MRRFPRKLAVICLATAFPLAGCLSGSGGGGGGVGGAPIVDAGSSGGTSSGGTSSGGTSSGGTSSGGTSSGGAGTPLGAAQEQAGANCEKAFECCTTDELSKKFLFTGAPKDVADCKKSQNSFLELFISVINESISKQRLAFKSDKVAGCVAATKSMSCAAYGKLKGGSAPTVCSAIFQGLVAKGGACTQDIECTTGFCTGSSSKEGSCADMPKEGDDCDEPCGDMACANGKCTKLEESGDPFCDGK